MVTNTKSVWRRAISQIKWWQVLVTALIGFLCGLGIGTRFDPLGRLARKGITANPLNVERPTDEATQLVDIYQAETVRLKKYLSSTAARLREKEMILLQMERRGGGPDSPLCQRLTCEIADLREAIIRTESRLAEVTAQRARLAVVRNSPPDPSMGLEPHIEVQAHKVILEHKLGLTPGTASE